MPKPKLYWDSCVFIALLMNEERLDGEMDGVMAVVDLADREEVLIITSILSNTEVLDPSSNGVREQFDLLFKRPNFIRAALTDPISRLAADLRERMRQEDYSLKTPDSIHLATALAHTADEFHTFDPNILRHNGHDALRGLTISKPRGAEQTEIPFG